MATESAYLQPWQAVSEESTRQILNDLLEKDFFGIQYAQQIKLSSKQLTFYPGYTLYWYQADYPHGQENRYYLGNPSKKDYRSLDWTKNPIYQLNSECPLELNLETAADYISFFFDFVSGSQGVSAIVDRPAHPVFQQDDFLNLPEENKKKVKSLLLPLQFSVAEEKLKAKASVIFKDYLFHTDITVHPTYEDEFRNKTVGSIELGDGKDVFQFPYTPSTGLTGKPKANWTKASDETPVNKDGIKKENVLTYIKQNLQNGLLINDYPFNRMEDKNYLFEYVDDFIWKPWLLKEEKQKLNNALNNLVVAKF